MAKTLNEAPITTANARKNLSHGLYWRRIDPDVHLGYRKGKRGGVWLVRWRDGKGYKQAPLGAADDVVKEGTLAFAKAEIAARAHVEQARIEAKAIAEGPALTVRTAVERYIEMRDRRDSERRGRPVQSDAGQRLGRFLLGTSKRKDAPPAAKIADIELFKLHEKDLRAWRDGLPASLKGVSRQRLANDLKAALNATYETERDRLPTGFSETIRFGLRAARSDEPMEDVARDNQILSDAQVSRLLRAVREVDNEQDWEGDLYRLMVLLAATGARFSQVSRMLVRDIQVDGRRAFVPFSRKGRGAKLGHTPVPIGQDTIEVLAPVIAGRGPGEPLLERWRRKQVPGFTENKWEKDRRGAWQSSSEFGRAWKAVRERAEMHDVDVYAFRHSSVVRGIRANLPIRLVAATHNTSVQMIERHYSRWIVDGLDELAATAVVRLVHDDDDNVINISACS